LGVEETLLGRKVLCMKCQAVFVAALPTSKQNEAEEESEGGSYEIKEESQRTRSSRREAITDQPQRYPRSDPYEDDDDYDDDEFEEGPRRRRRRRRNRGEPHRAGLVLGLGIAAIACNCLCGFLGVGLGIGAVAMAGKDIADMDARQMDDSGRGMTRAGQICGIVGIVLGIVALIWTGILIATDK